MVNVVREDMEASALSRDTRLFRGLLLLGVLINLALIGYVAYLYPQAIGKTERDQAFTAALALCLIAYGVIGVMVGGRPRGPVAAWAHRRGISYGVVIGVIWIVQMCFEKLTNPDPTMESNVGYATFFVVFALYTLAGVRGAWATRAMSTGASAAAWSAMVGSLMAVTCALVLNDFFIDVLAASSSAQAAFVVSGRSDLLVFLIQDTIAGALITLTILGPIAGALCGLVGGLVTRVIINPHG